MKNICFYFQVHQPYRVSQYRIFDHGTGKEYFEGPFTATNKAVFEKVARKCYLPANDLLLDLLNKYPEFKISFSLSGVFLEQCLEFGDIGKQVLDSFKKLVKTGQVELLSETYYHSLSGLYSKQEFAEQIHTHRQLIKEIFKVKPKVFRNTELIYNNDLGKFIQNLGFDGMLMEGWDYVLGDRFPGDIYTTPDFDLDKGAAKVAKKYKIKRPSKNFGLLLKNYKLSDDIAFRFSNKSWAEHPLTTEKFVHWASQAYGDTVNLFMDYETFGEHQWEDTGIFEFLRNLPEACFRHGIGFHTPSEAIKNIEHRDIIDVHHYLSWADMERDLSAWLDNPMQRHAMDRIYELEAKINQIGDENLKHTWRKLQTSDHFYYMCTKYWSDGDVHAYFSPFDSPYEAYINYINVITDFEHQVDNLLKDAS